MYLVIMMRIILASKSPYRKELLKRLGIEFECVNSHLDENLLKSEIKDPVKLTQALALEKAKIVAKEYNDAVVIGSDQVAHLGQEILGKTGSYEGSIEQLLKLQGKNHELITSYAIIFKGKELVRTNKTTLTMRRLDISQIKKYLSNDNPIDCAGSYKLELNGISLFKNIETSDHTAIIGLPLIELGNDLNDLGISIPPIQGVKGCL